MNNRKTTVILHGVCLALFAAGCKKKVPAPPPPPPPPPVKEEAPPPPPRPAIALFVAEPATIERGKASNLRWETSAATDVSIDQSIGAVPTTGSRQVFPSGTTTYTLTASGPGGTASRSVTVTVTTAPPPPPPVAPKASFGERITNELKDAYFDFDKFDIREDARATLTRNADALKSILAAFPSDRVMLEGHCDERGSGEYNLALGDKRGQAAKEFLIQLGVPGDRLNVISYGEERPQCTESNEDCWQLNRRVHFVPAQ